MASEKQPNQSRIPIIIITTCLALLIGLGLFFTVNMQNGNSSVQQGDTPTLAKSTPLPSPTRTPITISERGPTEVFADGIIENIAPAEQELARLNIQPLQCMKTESVNFSQANIATIEDPNFQNAVKQLLNHSYHAYNPYNFDWKQNDDSETYQFDTITIQDLCVFNDTYYAIISLQERPRPVSLSFLFPQVHAAGGASAPTSLVVITPDNSITVSNYITQKNQRIREDISPFAYYSCRQILGISETNDNLYVLCSGGDFGAGGEGVSAIKLTDIKSPPREILSCISAFPSAFPEESAESNDNTLSITQCFDQNGTVIHRMIE